MTFHFRMPFDPKKWYAENQTEQRAKARSRVFGYQEALTQAHRVYARQALNVPGSFHYIYRKAKRYVA